MLPTDFTGNSAKNVRYCPLVARAAQHQRFPSQVAPNERLSQINEEDKRATGGFGGSLRAQRKRETWVFLFFLVETTRVREGRELLFPKRFMSGIRQAIVCVCALYQDPLIELLCSNEGVCMSRVFSPTLSSKSSRSRIWLRRILNFNVDVTKSKPQNEQSCIK
ncbi:hypothetical protein EV363DRAFT_1420018 [Boletus edulis]|nr:hypothetical protein EV363DRAFT_1420018 [Boletus edulis]